VTRQELAIGRAAAMAHARPLAYAAATVMADVLLLLLL
jgi:hypothetical protein